MKQDIESKKTVNMIDIRKKYSGKRNKGWMMFAVLFAGFLLSVMVTMMYIGREINFKRFLSPGTVYDVSQRELKKSSSGGWSYEEPLQGHRLLRDNAMKKYTIDGIERTWGYLYIDIREMSLPQMDAVICYYNQNGKRIADQPVILQKGENTIVLLEEIPVRRLGIRIIGSYGEFISIQSMQIRKNASGYTPQRFLKIITVAYCGFLLALWFALCLRKRFSEKIGQWRGKWPGWDEHMEILQYIFQMFGDFMERKAGKKLPGEKRRICRRWLFFLLFFWSVFGNAWNWSTDKGLYRYYVLICMILLVMIAIVSWERPLKPVKWKNPLAVSWFGLCLGMIISDIFIAKSFAMVGWMLVLGGGYFIFAWGNMQYPKELVDDIFAALKLLFFIGTAYCMVCRTKKLAIDYNGLFGSSEEFAMYAALMFGVFLTELDGVIKESIYLLRENTKEDWQEKLWKKYLISVSGAAIAFFFLIRTANVTGYVVTIVMLALLIGKTFLAVKENMIVLRKIWYKAAFGVMASFLIVCGVHVSTKYLPGLLGTEIEYKGEVLLTGVSDEMKEAFELLEPGLMAGVRQKEDMEPLIVWKTYLRKWNLLGNAAKALTVFRKRTQAGNGYITLAYRYGLFVLLPYVIWQFSLLLTSIKKYIQGRKRTSLDRDFWLCTVTVAFLGFCMYGNVELPFGHPLWLCCYLGTGYWFANAEI